MKTVALLLSLATLGACSMADPSAVPAQKAAVYGGGAAGTANVPLTVSNGNGGTTTTAGTVYVPSK